jgi:predicted nucleotide-binding protein
VFVVYGHDPKARAELENILHRLKLEPLILDQLPSEGQTIIEKIEHYRHQASYAVIVHALVGLG